MTPITGSFGEAAWLLRDPRLRWQIARVLVLVLLTSLTEGIGLVLLVPLLASISGGGIPPLLAHSLAGLSLPVRLGPLLIVFVGIVLLRSVIQYARVINGDKLSYAVADGLRIETLKLLLGANWRTLSAMRQSDNVNLLLTNPDRIRFAFDQIITGVAILATLAATGLAAFALAPRVALVVMAAGVLVLIAYAGQRRRAVALGEALSAAYEHLFALVGENLGALRLIKSLHGEARVQAELTRTIKAQRAAELAFTRSAQTGQVTLQVFSATALALSVWIAVEKLGIAATVLLPLAALFARAMPLLSALQQSWQNWLHGAPALRELLALNERLAIAQEHAPAEAAVPPRLDHAIVLEAVSLRHEGSAQPALCEVSMTLPARSFTALVGASGAGKSTLADIVGGLISPDAGQVTIDGVPIVGALRRSWREAVAYVQQEPLLFHASIAENLRWAKPNADANAMQTALENASAHFALTLANGLDTIVGDRGSRLSGGERQRIALARALLRDPALLILDEPTSALDSASEAAIGKALEQLKGKITILLIAHRGSLTALADQVVTLDGGRIVDRTKDRIDTQSDN